MLVERATKIGQSFRVVGAECKVVMDVLGHAARLAFSVTFDQ
jgi:hypothetical protein